MEQCDLTTPEIYPPANPTTAYWKLDELHLIWASQSITITLIGQNGERKTFAYDGSIATALMSALNTANLSIKSLQRRVLERLIADGKLAGTISGVPA